MVSSDFLVDNAIAGENARITSRTQLLDDAEQLQ
jgi:hypothetical protein